jgi:hypothetical protein
MPPKRKESLVERRGSKELKIECDPLYIPVYYVDRQIDEEKSTLKK